MKLILFISLLIVLQVVHCKPNNGKCKTMKYDKKPKEETLSLNAIMAIKDPKSPHMTPSLYQN